MRRELAKLINRIINQGYHDYQMAVFYGNGVFNVIRSDRMRYQKMLRDFPCDFMGLYDKNISISELIDDMMFMVGEELKRWSK